MHRFLRDEQGAAIIQLSLLMVILLGFSAMVLDMGVVWSARSQAQNTADAAAIAGATSRAFDDYADPPLSTGNAYASAYQIATSDPNRVFQATPGVAISWDCPSWYAGGGVCARVDIFRDGTNGSATLPPFFSRVLGASAADQLMRTKASATAVAGDANHTNCLKPWLIPDKYTELGGDPNAFDLNIDQYTAPGYTTADIGTTLVLHAGSPSTAAAPSNYYAATVSGNATDYLPAITGCTMVASIGDWIWTRPGNVGHPTGVAVNTLIANGPVTVPIGLFSPAAWAALDRSTGKFKIQITNMMGFRISSADNFGAVTGTIVAAPGEIISGVTGPPSAGSFLKAIQLIQ